MADDRGAVVLIHGRQDERAAAMLVPELVAALAGRGVVEAVADAAAVRAVLERYIASERFVAALICASDPASAATLIWELAEPGSRAFYGARIVVVVATAKRLASLPARLLEAFEFLAFDELGADRAIEAALDRVAGLKPAPRPVDLLASVYRSAIARRSLDGLLALHSSAGRVVEIDPRQLSGAARVGDRGPRPNPLWSHWITHGRVLELAEPSAKQAPRKKSRKQ